MGSGIGIVSLLDSGIWVLTVASDCGSIAVNRSADTYDKMSYTVSNMAQLSVDNDGSMQTCPRL